METSELNYFGKALHWVIFILSSSYRNECREISRRHNRMDLYNKLLKEGLDPVRDLERIEKCLYVN